METMLVSVRGATNQTTNGMSFTTEGLTEFLPMGMGIDQQDFASQMEGFAFNGVRGLLVLVTHWDVPLMIRIPRHSQKLQAMM